jgi:vacuolar-type H+-ATPase subunit B/Vma2
MRPIDIRTRLDALNHEWRSMTIIEQDHRGAEYAVRFAMLAEEALAEADRWFNETFDRFDQSQ